MLTAAFLVGLRAGILRLIALSRLEFTRLSTINAFFTFFTSVLGFWLMIEGLRLLCFTGLGLGDLCCFGAEGERDLGDFVRFFRLFSIITEWSSSSFCFFEVACSSSEDSTLVLFPLT